MSIFSVNGTQVIFHGVNRHETHPVQGRMFDEQYARADMIMMKRAGSMRSAPATIRRIRAYLILLTSSASG